MVTFLCSRPAFHPPQWRTVQVAKSSSEPSVYRIEEAHQLVRLPPPAVPAPPHASSLAKVAFCGPTYVLLHRLLCRFLWMF